MAGVDIHSYHELCTLDSVGVERWGTCWALMESNDCRHECEVSRRAKKRLTCCGLYTCNECRDHIAAPKKITSHGCVQRVWLRRSLFRPLMGGSWNVRRHQCQLVAKTPQDTAKHPHPTSPSRYSRQLRHPRKIKLKAHGLQAADLSVRSMGCWDVPLELPFTAPCPTFEKHTCGIALCA